MKRRGYGILLLIGAVAAFIFGLSGLFHDRFEEGDIYPAYSTLRSDPMGCRALYAALGNYSGVEASQVFSEADYRARERNAAFFFLGYPPASFWLPMGSAQAPDSLAAEGNRVVIAFSPLIGGPDKDARDDFSSDSMETVEAKKPPKFPKGLHPIPPPKKSWGCLLRLDTTDRAAEDVPATVSPLPSYSASAVSAPNGTRNIQDTVPWISDLYFDSLESVWTVLYRHNNLPVVIARPVGRGTLILMADSYWASNEALFHSLPGRLLSVLASGRTRLLFDERHLGISRNSSLVDLLIKYRLHLLLPSLLLLFFAYLWKSRNDLNPMPRAGARESAGDRTESASGMLGLLERNIREDDLLENCYSQWKETEGKNSAAVRRVDEEAGKILAEHRASKGSALLDDYRKIQSIINQRKYP